MRLTRLANLLVAATVVCGGAVAMAAMPDHPWSLGGVAQAEVALLHTDDDSALYAALSLVKSGAVWLDLSMFKADAKARAAVVPRLGTALKAVVNTPIFARLYQAARDEERNSRIGSLPDDPMESVRAMEEAVANARQQAQNPEIPAEQRAELLAMVPMFEQQAADIRAQIATPEFQAQMAQARAEYERENAEVLATFDREYPADVKHAVLKKLDEFLALSAGIPFDARLVADGDRKRFADAALEEKDPTWKLCFRAGRETVEAARTFATQWKAELSR